MTPDPRVLSYEDNIEEAIILMEELGEPSAPVVDENQRISGSVLIDDIWRSIWYNREGEDKGEFVGEKVKLQIEVKAFVSPIAVAKKDELLKDICSSMTRVNPYICAVVDDSQMPIGVITQYDILKRLVRYEYERGVFLDITGFEIKDPFLYSSMITKLERFIEKAGKYSWLVPYKLNLDIGGQNKGGRTSWNLRARLSTDLALLNVKSQGWDLLTCVDDIVEELNRRIIDIKPEHTI